MRVCTITAIVLALVALCICEIVRYDGHKVVSVQATNRNQLQWLGKLQETSPLDFWTQPSLIRPTDIRVSPDEYNGLVSKLAAQGLNFTVVHEDVQKLIESVNQHPHSADKRQLNIIRNTVIGGFPTYDAIYKWVQQKRSTNREIMSFHTLGKTYEGRDQYLIKLGVPGSTSKPAIWLDGGIHAREWLAVSTTMNIINGLLNGYEVKVPGVVDMLTTFDFYIVPVANPDGYVYSHTSGGRSWRKTRTRYSGGTGADPNRNWNYHWCETGSSRSVQSDQYCGPSQWSEKCVKNIATMLQSLAPRLKVYMTLHSYGQMWFVPYAWSKTAYPSDYQHLMSVGNSAVAAMKKSTGVTYRVGRVPDLLYEAGGSSMDWVKGVLGTEYAFGMELRPARRANGFIASVSDIQPSAQEVWEGLKVIIQKAKDKLVTG